jgi:hypothetical protein
MRIHAAAMAAALSLVGCAPLHEPAPVTEPVPQPPKEQPREASQSEADRMLAYFASLRRMPAADVARERETARRAMAADGSDEHRMRMALALAVSVDGNVETARAIELVEPIARRRESPYQALAIALRSLLSDLQQAQRERADLQRRLDSLKALESDLQQAQRERADLQRKLDSLKALEKSLSDREGTTK